MEQRKRDALGHPGQRFLFLCLDPSGARGTGLALVARWTARTKAPASSAMGTSATSLRALTTIS
jgi:hypothetical protein